MEVGRSRKFYGQVAWSMHRKEVLSKEALAQGQERERNRDTEREKGGARGIRETGVQGYRSGEASCQSPTTSDPREEAKGAKAPGCPSAGPELSLAIVLSRLCLRESHPSTLIAKALAWQGTERSKRSQNK